MNHLLVNVCCAAIAASICASFLVFDRLLRMESKSPEDQRHQGGRAVGIFGITQEMSGPYPRWEDIRAWVLGLRLYAIWLFRMPLWVRNDARARRALWMMRSLFWLSIVGTEVVKEIFL